MSLAEKMRSFYKMKERQAKERADDQPLPLGAGSRGTPPSKST